MSHIKFQRVAGKNEHGVYHRLDLDDKALNELVDLLRFTSRKLPETKMQGFDLITSDKVKHLTSELIEVIQGVHHE